MSANKTHVCTHPMKVAATDSGEIVCTECGVVLERDSFGASHIQYCAGGNNIPANWAERSNLFVQKALGSRECREREQPELSIFSNVCEKLSLPVCTREDAWNHYCKLRKGLKGNRFSKAELAGYAIYEASKKSRVPLPEEEIMETVSSWFHVSGTRSLRRITYKILTRPEANPDLCNNYSISDNDSDARYHVTAALRRFISNGALYSMCKQEASVIFNLLEKNHSDRYKDTSSITEENTRRRKARKSVEVASTLLDLGEVMAAI